ncbi:hypothetical protein L6452_33285 [Arctium lappa]|uniref:Uncharacterized protein n=1 Tax=Arctium lappa TaxID=4217 RepID=A0ACB8Z839_ARCLA|nr:hypothetical protein L6452_33285 [Arctium lappa]
MGRRGYISAPGHVLCVCGAGKSIEEKGQRKKLMQLVMVLNDTCTIVIGLILFLIPPQPQSKCIIARSLLERLHYKEIVEMKFKQERYVRFKDTSPEQSYRFDQRIPTTYGLYHMKLKPPFSSLMNGIQRGIKQAYKVAMKKILDPQGSFLQKWNKIFVIISIIAVSLDPLFFYIPVMDSNKNCLDVDNNMKIISCVLRTLIDLIYILHILFEFRTGFLAPASRIVGRGELIEDSFAIAKRYFCSYFFIDLLSILPLPQMIGSFWYLLSIDRKDSCWRAACKVNKPCDVNSLYCGEKREGNYTFLNTSCPLLQPDEIKSSSDFDFGIFLDAFQSHVVETKDFPQKLLYCFWWGLRNLSSVGQNLKTSTYVWEILFAIFISIIGLIFFALLIGNMQKYLQSITVRVVEEEMRVKRRDAELWMSRRLLPEELKERIRCYEQYKWQENRGVDEQSLIQNLPKDLRRDIKRHICLSLLMEVSDFCGDELLAWALDPNLSSSLPLSTRTVIAVTGVEAFALKADDLKFVASQFKSLHSKRVQNTFRYYSQQWRTWGACFIQVAWHRHCRKKQEQALWEEEKRLQDALAKGGENSSPSLGVAIYASRFAANILPNLKRNHSNRPKLLPTMGLSMLPQKPVDPDFSTVDPE